MASANQTQTTAEQVRGALRNRYAAPEFALLEEVRNATGRMREKPGRRMGSGKKARYADMLAMSLYPSAGLEMIGFEIKVSRADWINELKDLSKSDAISKYCDRWYLVIGDISIIKDGELPAGWGLLILHDGQIIEAVPAPKREAQDVDRAFLASLLRNATMAATPQVVKPRTRTRKPRVVAKTASGWRGSSKKADPYLMMVG